MKPSRGVSVLNASLHKDSQALVSQCTASVTARLCSSSYQSVGDSPSEGKKAALRGSRYLGQAPLQAILFDLDNTLLARDEAVEAMLREDFSQEETRDALRELDASGLACRDRLFREWEKRSGIRVSQENFVDRLVSHLQPIPRLLSSLKKLSENYEIGLITNGGHRSQWAKLKACGLDEIFSVHRVWISADLGFAKPDPRIFWRACESLQLEPSVCLYVGDSEEIDGLGACRAGLHFQKGWAF